jgi:phytoene dehydrogenase-like protein
MENTHFDAIIIGAGMSGLAAGIRLALFNKKVLILERHNACGGLNSFYSIKGRKYDVGLHALTNYVPPKVNVGPLTKIFRQLRIARSAFNLSPQKASSIAFPDVSIHFSNDFSLFESEIAQQFPQEIDGFRSLVCFIKAFNDTALEQPIGSARSLIQNYIHNPLLTDVLLLPLMYYGCAQEHDMELAQFVTLFKSIYCEGFARPYEGVRIILKALIDQYRSLGGQRRMKCGVQKLIVKHESVHAVELDDGSTVTADCVLSSIGWPETLQLCTDQFPKTAPHNIGQLSFVEAIIVLNTSPHVLGWEDTILFFNQTNRLDYCRPNEAVDLKSGVICFPNNYDYPEAKELDEGWLRITALANYEKWAHYSQEAYAEHKQAWLNQLQANALSHLKPLERPISDLTVATDMFTPTTIQRFTGRLAGAVYGAPNKSRTGETHLKNLFLCGTDQGFLGIVGALLSGISMANLHVLSKVKI